MKSALEVVSTGPQTLEELIDEYGELDRQVSQFRPVADRYETCKKLLKGQLDGQAPAHESFVRTGFGYELQVSARASERKIGSMASVYKAFRKLGGLKAFLEVCSIAIGVLEEKLGKSGAAGLLVEERTGSRRLKPVALAVGRPPIEAA